MSDLDLYLEMMREWGEIAGIDGIVEDAAYRLLWGDVTGARRILEQLVVLGLGMHVFSPPGFFAITARVK